MQDQIKLLVKLTAAFVALGAAGVWIGADVEFIEDGLDLLLARLQYLGIFAIVIERATQTYLLGTDSDGTPRSEVPLVGKTKDASQTAMRVSFALGLLVAVAGLRLLDAVAELKDAGLVASFLWTGADIFITAGLLAGGASLFHELPEAFRLLFAKKLPGSTPPARSTSTAAENLSTLGALPTGTTITLGGVAAPLLTEYRVSIVRTGRDSGDLTFNSRSVHVQTPCWWDPENKIAAATYSKCSKTRMTTKTDSVTGENRPAIFLPDAESMKTGKHEIFLHEGKDPSWSDGCIVLNRERFLEIWNEISLSDGKNIAITITDAI